MMLTSRYRHLLTDTFSLHSSAHYRYLHSFPTRRSSDLTLERLIGRDTLAKIDRSLGSARNKSAMFLLFLLPGLPKEDRKSTRLNSSHQIISYAVFCLKKKKIHKKISTINNIHPITLSTS